MQQYGIQSQGRLNVHDHSNILLGGNVPLASLTGHNKAVHDALALAYASLDLSGHTKAVHDALGILHSSLGGKTANDHHAQAHNLDTHAVRTHANLQTIGEGDHHAKAQPHSGTTGRTSGDHHAQSHSLGSHSSKAHTELTGVSANQHHTPPGTPSSAELSFALACRAYRSSSQTGIANDTITKVLYNAEAYDLGSDFDADGSDSKYTAPSNGYYFIFAHVLIDNAGTVSIPMRAFIYKNGASIAQSAIKHDSGPIGAGNVGVFISTTEYLTTGKTIDIRVWQKSGVSRTIGAGITVNYVCIRKVGV